MYGFLFFGDKVESLQRKMLPLFLSLHLEPSWHLFKLTPLLSTDSFPPQMQAISNFVTSFFRTFVICGLSFPTLHELSQTWLLHTPFFSHFGKMWSITLFVITNFAGFVCFYICCVTLPIKSLFLFLWHQE